MKVLSEQQMEQLLIDKPKETIYPVKEQALVAPMGRALRYNKGKIRKELIPIEFIDALAKVYTMGAEKYTTPEEDGSNNWRKGLSWKQTLGAVRRHLDKFENGEDFDYDWPQDLIDKYGPTLHLANAGWGIAALTNFMKSHPELDDRQHSYLTHPKIGLDIDNVICDWTKGWGEFYGVNPRPDAWSFSYGNSIKFRETPKEELETLYRGLPRQIDPNELPFEPHCYITARSIDEKLTKEWIEANGFPCVPVYTVPFGHSKVEVAKQAGIEWMIDDSYANFIELNNAGIVCFLYDAPHNQRYDVGYKRIKDFKDFKQRFL